MSEYNGGYQPWLPPPAPRPVSAIGVSALVLGVLGLPLSWVPVLQFLIPVSAFLLGAIGLETAGRCGASKGFAIAGFVLGPVGFVFGFGWYVLQAISRTG